MSPTDFPPSDRATGGRRWPAVLWRTLFLIGLAAPGLAAAQAVRVGPASDPACDFSDLQQAINSVPLGGSITVHLSAASGFEALGPVFIVDRDVRIEGGYNGCSARERLPGLRSVVTSRSGSGSVLAVFSRAQPVPRTIELLDVELRDGVAPSGGGLYVTGTNRVTLERSRVVGNHADGDGGGIWVGGGQGAVLILGEDSLVDGNRAGARGGGIRCEHARIDVEDAVVDANLAGTLGGGISADRCTIVGPSRRLVVSNNRVDVLEAIGAPSFDIDGRAAGGGLHLGDATGMAGGHPGSALEVTGNRVRHAELGSFDDFGDGGGLKLTGRSNVVLRNAHLAYNTADRGGGAFVGSEATLRIEAELDDCSEGLTYPGCASVFANHAAGHVDGACDAWGGTGGAIATRDFAEVSLDNVIVRSNRVTRPQPSDCAPVIRREGLGNAFDVAERSSLSLAGSLVSGNSGSRESDVVHVRGAAPVFSAEYSTFVGNSRFVPLFRTSGGGDGAGPSLRFAGSILDEPSGELYRNVSGYARLGLDCVQVSDVGALQSAPDRDFSQVGVGDPGFNDRLDQDFGLRADSPALDACSLVPERGVPPSLDGGARPRLVSSRQHSPFDIGAYERQQGLVVVDLSLLSLDVAPGGVPGEDYVIHARVRNNGPAAAERPVVVLTPDPHGLPVLPPTAPESPWQCVASAGQLLCELDDTLAAGATAPALEVARRAPAQPRGLFESARTAVPGAQLDEEPGNDEATLLHGIALDADLEARVPPKAALTLREGEPVFFGFHFRNEGPDAAWQPEVELLFPAGVGGLSDSIGAKAQEDWSCAPPQRLADGRQRVACAASSMAPGEDAYFGWFGVVAVGQAGQSWQIQSSIASVSDPDIPGRRPNAVVQAFDILPADGLVLDGSGPASVAFDRRQSYSLVVRNSRGESTGTFHVGAQVDRGLFDSVEVLAEGADCEPFGPAAAPVQRSDKSQQLTDGFQCSFAEALAPGASRRIDFSLVPRSAEGDRWPLYAYAYDEAGDGGVYAVVLDAPIDAASLPPEGRVFASGFE